ncbi:hypothetical protein GN244_ATG01829 [Phytophthora infestans]|uniref:Uncharacterized protein n=1 Tax=Phytophthora infestans TaxID=4787 RepID=A0A833W7P5_PHYIN|nr:hypothetical protein GN244_ATG01829 [Phytophthora infestans]KAF4148903.1 hypothetical protein GN958_ATG01917 [Phytophthora infestans]
MVRQGNVAISLQFALVPNRAQEQFALAGAVITREEDELLSVPFMLTLLGNAALDHSPRQPKQRTDAPAIGQSGPHLVVSISTEPTALPEASSQRGRSRSKLSKRKSQAPDTNSDKTNPQKKKKRSSSGSSDSIDTEKPKRMTAHESRASLSFAYTKTWRGQNQLHEEKAGAGRKNAEGAAKRKQSPAGT